MFARTVIGLLLVAAAEIGFASTFVFGAKLTKDCSVSPAVLSFLRFLIAGSILFAGKCLTRAGRKALFAPRARDFASFAWLGPVGTSLMAWFVFLGCARVSAANASMADALTPLMIFAVAAVRTRRAKPRELIGLGCGLVGALLVIQVIHAHGIALSAYSLGDVFILLAAATWGVYTVYGREPIRRFGATVFSAWTMLIGAAVMGAALPFCGGAWPTTPSAWLLTLLLGLISTLMSFWTWNAAQKFLPMSVLSVSAYSTPVAAMALAYLFLGERITLLQGIGAFLVLLSAAVETRASAVPAKKEAFSMRTGGLLDQHGGIVRPCQGNCETMSGELRDHVRGSKRPCQVN